MPFTKLSELLKLLKLQGMSDRSLAYEESKPAEKLTHYEWCHGSRLLAHPLATQSSPLRVNFFNSLVIY